MSRHLFGLIVTPYGIAANNRGETAGNITTLQKILWRGEVHTTVSAEAIRFAIRRYWQAVHGEQVLNRRWDDDAFVHSWADPEFARWADHLDDDVLGFMSARAAKNEANEAEDGGPERRGKRKRGTCDRRRARLEITRAVSCTPYAGDVTFNAASPGATPSASKEPGFPVPYGTEVHATRYQYGFALTPGDLRDRSRAMHVIDAVVCLSRVAGNHGRFLFDFSPDSAVFRWTEDFVPRILYGFTMDDNGCLGISEILDKVKAGDIDAAEIVIGGSIADADCAKELKARGARVFRSVKTAGEEVKKEIKAWVEQMPNNNA